MAKKTIKKRADTGDLALSEGILMLSPVQVTRQGIIFPDKLSYGDWRAAFASFHQRAMVMADVLPLCLGDLLLHGRENFQDSHQKEFGELIRGLGLRADIISDYAKVAEIPMAQRRIPPLTFQHLAEARRAKKSDRDKWLADAASHGWDYLKLREEINRSMADQGTTGLKLDFGADFARHRLNFERSLIQLGDPKTMPPHERQQLDEDLEQIEIKIHEYRTQLTTP